MRRGNADPDQRNRAVFDMPRTVEGYAGRASELTPVESHVFRRFLCEGSEILDLGVGTGRTTSFLSSIASRYVGLDYSDRMITRCRERFPNVSLIVGDAADLSAFADSDFDAVVFSFNGMDYLAPDARRRACLVEVNRVLRPGGVFIFSSHNARQLASLPDPPPQAEWSPIKTAGVAAIGTARLLRRRVFSAALWRGSGYVVDSAQGLVTHVTTPEVVARELAQTGFVGEACVGSCHPRRRPSVAIPWYYFVYRSRGASS